MFLACRGLGRDMLRRIRAIGRSCAPLADLHGLSSPEVTAAPTSSITSSACRQLPVRDVPEDSFTDCSSTPRCTEIVVLLVLRLEPLRSRWRRLARLGDLDVWNRRARALSLPNDWRKSSWVVDPIHRRRPPRATASAGSRRPSSRGGPPAPTNTWRSRDEQEASSLSSRAWMTPFTGLEVAAVPVPAINEPSRARRVDTLSACRDVPP